MAFKRIPRSSNRKNRSTYRRLQFEALEPRIVLANSMPLAPAIDQPVSDGEIVSPFDVHMEAEPFSDPDAGDTHTASQWEIWTNSGTIERVWSSFPQGTVEMVHTHLGDGTFENSHAGRTDLLPLADYQLRVRYRDSSGDPATQWSPYSIRDFTTGALSQTFPLETEDARNVPPVEWKDANGNDIILPAGSSPPSISLESASGELLLRIEGFDNVDNATTNPPELSDHIDVRARISAGLGQGGVLLPESNLSFTNDDGVRVTVYLPSVSVAEGDDQYFWISQNGSTYEGSAAQAEPDFSLLARGAPVPWSAPAGYKVEVVATGFQLPVNIAFIPNAGTNPNDPLYYVTELYGTIKVVRRDGTVSDFATDLLNFDPTGNFPGSGEQGVSGIVVDPATGDVYASMVTDTDGQPGGDHHPIVVRLHSNDGGLTAATQTTILDMVGESQGQSHFVSNLSIGPDGKLYVHNGDGFDAATALDLESFRGKVLRINLDGSPASDNPFYNAGDGITARDYIFAYGFRNPFGGAWRDADGQHYAVDVGPSVDRLAKIEAGVSYGWAGSNSDMTTGAIYNWQNPPVAPVNLAFIQSSAFGGSGFPAAADGYLFVTKSGPTYATGPQNNSKSITQFELDGSGNIISGPVDFVKYNGSGKATAVGLAAGPDGLYFTDLYKDLNYSSPIDAGANVLRIQYVGDVAFVASTRSGPAPLTVQFTDVSDVPGASAWLWDFGDGNTSTQQNPQHSYTVNGIFDVSLTVTGAGGIVTEVEHDFITTGSMAAFDTTDDGTGTITAQGENGNFEGAAKAFDNDPSTKWLDFAAANPTTRASWIQYQYANDERFVVTSYTITSANDFPARDPRDWIFQGSDDGFNWTDLDVRANQSFANRFEKKTFLTNNDTAYEFYRLEITSVANPPAANSVQLAELEFIGVPEGNVPAATVTIEATDPSAAEGSSPNIGLFTVTRTGPTETALQVNYAVNGTANSSDYLEFLAGTVEIPVGASSTTISITPVDDALEESAETVQITIANSTDYIIGASNTATVTISDDDSAPAPSDTTDSGTGTITAQGENGTFEGAAKAFDNDSNTKWLDFAPANPSTRASWIQYQYANNERFVVTSYTITSANDFPARDPSDWIFQGSDDGVTWTDLDVRANQIFANRFEKKSFLINNGTAYEFYRLEITSVANPPAANSVQLAELEFFGVPEGGVSSPTVVIQATDASAAEGSPPDTAAFAINRSGSTDDTLLVNYSISGTVDSSDYFENLSGTVEIPVGSSSTTILITPVDDILEEPAETLQLSLASGTYIIGASNTATITISDDDSAPAPTDTTDSGTGTITAQGENGTFEGAAKAFDNDSNTKWLDFAPANPSTRASWIQYQYANNERFVVTSYTITSANDFPARDPRDWVFQGSNDGITWIDLDTQVNQFFDGRFEKHPFSFSNSAAYEFYRLEITSVANPPAANSVQLAELEFIGVPEGGVSSPTVVIQATDASAAENFPPDTAAFSITRTGSTDDTLLVNYSVSGTADSSDYFENLTGTVEIPAGSSSATILITPLDDVLEEPAETLQLSLASGAYVIGASSTAAVTIVDNDAPLDPFDTTNGGSGTISAQGENGPFEGAAQAFDNNSGTKWLDFAEANPSTRASWIQYQYANDQRFVVTSYTITSANDVPARDPRDWVFQGSNDGTNWTDLDTQVNQIFDGRFEKHAFSFSNSAAYEFYRLAITSVADPGAANSVQLSELEFSGLPESPPGAVNDNYVAVEGGTLAAGDAGGSNGDEGDDGVLANDHGFQTSAVSVLNGPRHGDVSMAPDGTFVYVHDGGESANDSFTYIVNDGETGIDQVEHVILISVDGLNAGLLQTLIATDTTGDYASFQRLIDEGTYTFNARTDVTDTSTLPNHTSLLTGRPVSQPAGQPNTVHHGYTSNDQPAPSDTLHNQGNPNVSYVAGIFDVVHDNGLTTALYASKSKFAIYEQSWDADSGASDSTGVDNGMDKIDFYVNQVTQPVGAPENASELHATFISDMAANHFDFSFVHYRDPDSAGHSAGWGSAAWNNAVASVDDYLGDILDLVETDALLDDKTIVIVTADHGGVGTGHGDANHPSNYRVPFFLWGAGIEEASNLYTVAAASRQNPGGSHPDFNEPIQPVRNADAGNLVLDLLGLGPIPGSTIDANTDLGVAANVGKVNITINPVNDAPVLSGIGGNVLGYTVGQGPLAITNSIDVSDVDDELMFAAVIQISDNFAMGEDVLSFAGTANIASNWNAATATLTLSGADTLAAYRDALRNVLYENTSATPSTLRRTFSFSVDDGEDNSDEALQQLDIFIV